MKPLLHTSEIEKKLLSWKHKVTQPSEHENIHACTLPFVQRNGSRGHTHYIYIYIFFFLLTQHAFDEQCGLLATSKHILHELLIFIENSPSSLFFNHNSHENLLQWQIKVKFSQVVDMSWKTEMETSKQNTVLCKVMLPMTMSAFLTVWYNFLLVFSLVSRTSDCLNICYENVFEF